MRYFVAFFCLTFPFFKAFALYKSHSPTSKVTAPYLHIMDDQEKRDLKIEDDIDSFKAIEEKLEQRRQKMEESQIKKKKKGQDDTTTLKANVRNGLST